ncbi:hypothetical protein G7Z17_g1926 [Cylindrodendrum hubeiense]|uniref:non-specific serine/threonine protein kinase n=1 Tax=Cylindrodendrum hubeiense TaxID=595255 RepID=A0A9P5LEX9_9HYPO|nr:hypothetical protein G7Z17_g1926 [Cylindrodendrum hubeiense]
MMPRQQHINGGPPSPLADDSITGKFESLVSVLPALRAHKDSARIAVLLREVGFQDNILTVLKSGVTDLWIPITRECLPMSLGPGAFRRVLSRQPSFLSSSFTVGPKSQWPGEHFYLTTDAIDEWMKIPETLSHKGTLGQGGFGDVAEVACPEGRTYALKRIKRKTNFEEAQEQMRYIQTELDILRRIRHCHYIQLVGSYTEPRYVGILMNPVAECNLLQFLESFHDKKSNESLLASFFGCLATALASLHYVFCVRHKDIKPQNILVKDTKVIFTDFGMSLDWSENGYTTTCQEQLRTLVYCAPEVANDQPRNSMSDIWSLGCVFLEMAVVLKGKPRSFLRETMIEYGSQKYWDCPDGIKTVIGILRKDNSTWGNAPLDWVESMLQNRKEDRPNSRDLRNTIRKARGRCDQVFRGSCCMDDSMFDEDDADTMSHSSLSTRLDLSGTTAPVKPRSVRVHDPTNCAWSEVEVIENPRSAKNWVSGNIVTQCNLRIHSMDDTEIFVFEGRRFESKRRVTITWIADHIKKTRKSEFLVAPENVPFEMLVGKDFVDLFGSEAFNDVKEV